MRDVPPGVGLSRTQPPYRAANQWPETPPLRSSQGADKAVRGVHTRIHPRSRLRPLPGSGWLFVDGIVTLILAVLIWRTWPSSTEWVLGTLVGISMLFSGITRL